MLTEPAFRSVLLNIYSRKVGKIIKKKSRIVHLKTPVTESLFTKVAGLNPCNFIEKRLRHVCFPVKFLTFIRTPFLKKTSLVATSNRLMGPSKRSVNEILSEYTSCERTYWKNYFLRVFLKYTSYLPLQLC